MKNTGSAFSGSSRTSSPARLSTSRWVSLPKGPWIVTTQKLIVINIKLTLLKANLHLNNFEPNTQNTEYKIIGFRGSMLNMLEVAQGKFQESEDRKFVV